MSGELIWPEDFVDKEMCGKNFDWAYKNKTEWVDFTITEMKKPTGLFKQWQDYCLHRIKLEIENKETK